MADAHARAFVQGLPAPIVGAMAENASLFWGYTELQRVIRWWTGMPLSQNLSLGQLALAGGGAGCLTSFVLCVSSYYFPVCGAANCRAL